MATKPKQPATKESELYCKLDKNTRPHYLKLIGKLTREKLETLIKEATDEPCEIALNHIDTRVFVTIDGEEREITNARVVSAGANNTDHVGLFLYGMQGKYPSWIGPHNIGGRLDGIDLGVGITDCAALMDLPGAFSNSIDNWESYELDAAHALVLNTATTRARIDLYHLKPEVHKDDAIDLHELALLAQLKITTIRNYATPKHKDPIKTYQTPKGNTLVMVKDALPWLERNTKYQPTVFPTQPLFQEEGEENPFSQETINNFIYNRLESAT